MTDEHEKKRGTLILTLVAATALFIICVHQAAALPDAFVSTMLEVEEILIRLGAILAALIIAIEGLKWVTAQSPQERESAKKGIIYIVIGLLLLVNAENIVQFLLVNI